jgi:hypothetical protein
MAEITSQIHAEVSDKIGRLAELTDAIRDVGVNIRGAVAWVEGSTGHIRMITDDNDKACKAIQPIATACGFGQAVCVLVPNEVGTLNRISHKLAGAGIAIQMMYSSAAGEKAMVVLETSDNAKAAKII